MDGGKGPMFELLIDNGADLTETDSVSMLNESLDHVDCMPWIRFSSLSHIQIFVVIFSAVWRTSIKQS
jgi:hypothetical protein